MSTVHDEPVGTGGVTHTTIASKLGDVTVAARKGTVVGLGEYVAGDRQHFGVPVATDGDDGPNGYGP